MMNYKKTTKLLVIMILKMTLTMSTEVVGQKIAQCDVRKNFPSDCFLNTGGSNTQVTNPFICVLEGSVLDKTEITNKN